MKMLFDYQAFAMKIHLFIGYIKLVFPSTTKKNK